MRSSLRTRFDFNSSGRYEDVRGTTLVAVEAHIPEYETLYFKEWWVDAMGTLGSHSLMSMRPLHLLQVMSGVEYLHRSPHAQTKYGSHYGIRYVRVNSYITVEHRYILKLIVERVNQYHRIGTLKLSMARLVCKYLGAI